MSIQPLIDARETIEYCLAILDELPEEIQEIEAHNLYLHLKHAKIELRKVRFLLGGEEL